VRIDSNERLENLYIICKYLDLHFDCTIIIVEADNMQKIDTFFLPEKVEYHFIKDSNHIFHHTKYNNILIKLAKTPFIALYDTDVVFQIAQIVAAIDLLRRDQCQMVYPYDGHFISVGTLMKAMFSKILDPIFFENNQGKLKVATERSYGGCVFLNKKSYVSVGMDNEYFTGWGPEDIERWKRMLLLGYTIKRVSGNLYHLPHARTTNSGYNNVKDRISLVGEYLKICSMEKNHLKE
jgi:predicted glycosyltransferase involved in capsule biosynthesis